MKVPEFTPWAIKNFRIGVVSISKLVHYCYDNNNQRIDCSLDMCGNAEQLENNIINKNTTGITGTGND